MSTVLGWSAVVLCLFGIFFRMVFYYPCDHIDMKGNPEFTENTNQKSHRIFSNTTMSSIFREDTLKRVNVKPTHCKQFCSSSQTLEPCK